EAVEDDAPAAIELREARADHVDGDVVGNVLALVDELADLPPELGIAIHVVAEELTGRQLDPALRPNEHLRLRALPRPRRTHEDQIALAHLANEPLVGALEKLGFELLHRLDDDADDDEDARAAEAQRLHAGDVADERGHDRDGAEEERA